MSTPNTVTVKIRTSNAAFHADDADGDDDYAYWRQLAEIFGNLAYAAKVGRFPSTILDINGNHVGNIITSQEDEL